MQNRSDSNILLASVISGASMGVIYWLVEYFFSAIIPWFSIASHSLHTLHPGLTLFLLSLYTVAGGILGIAAAGSGLLKKKRGES